MSVRRCENIVPRVLQASLPIGRALTPDQIHVAKALYHLACALCAPHNPVSRAHLEGVIGALLPALPEAVGKALLHAAGARRPGVWERLVREERTRREEEASAGPGLG